MQQFNSIDYCGVCHSYADPQVWLEYAPGRYFHACEDCYEKYGEAALIKSHNYKRLNLKLNSTSLYGETIMKKFTTVI